MLRFRPARLVLYLDARALVKRYVAEEGSETLIEAMAAAEGWAICRIGYVYADLTHVATIALM